MNILSANVKVALAILCVSYAQCGAQSQQQLSLGGNQTAVFDKFSVTRGNSDHSSQIHILWSIHGVSRHQTIALPTA